MNIRGQPAGTQHYNCKLSALNIYYQSAAFNRRRIWLAVALVDIIMKTVILTLCALGNDVVGLGMSNHLTLKYRIHLRMTL